MKSLYKTKINQTFLSLCLVLCCSAGHAATTSSVSSPMNGAMNVTPSSLTVFAKMVNGSPSYTIDISTSPTFATIFQTQTSLLNSLACNNLPYGTKFYARVSINGGAYGMTTNFTTATPVVSNIANNAVGIGPASVAITSKLVPGAVDYTIELSTLSNFSSILQSNTGSNSHTFLSLSYGTKYYVRIKTDLPGYSNVYGHVNSFTTATPVVSNIGNNALGIGPSSVTIKSSVVPGAINYTIDLSTSSNFSSIFQSHTGSSTQIFVDLNYGTKYYARVSTDLPGYSGVFGAVHNFTTASPYVTNPKNGVMGVTLTTITSALVPGANQYTIDLSTDQNFINIVESQTGPNSLPFFNMTSLTKYYVRVKTDLQKSDLSLYGYGKTTYFTTGTLEAPPAAAPAAPPAASKRVAADNSADPAEPANSDRIEISAYPNPTRDYFKLLFKSDKSQEISLRMFDFTGSQIHSSVHHTNELIEVGQELKSGVYIMQVATPSGLKSIKLMKE